MGKIGILTFHYSNNYGGVLQALSLYRVLNSLGHDVEIIDYVPTDYKPFDYFVNLGIRKNIFKNSIGSLNLLKLLIKIKIISKHSKSIVKSFNDFRVDNMKLSHRVDEYSFKSILNNYSTIIVGSDQVWNPGQRKNPIYFLNFEDDFSGNKISYAADSTTNDIDSEDLENLKGALSEFKEISVRNKHSYDFVKTATKKDARIVADPTLLYDFQIDKCDEIVNEEYILVYILGKEIEGSHKKVIEKIRNRYGEIPVYSIKIPTMKFELFEFADKSYYDIDPNRWIQLFKCAKFIYTDSFHGVLFSLKFHKPFLAYYTEKLRSTRFIDLGERYGIEKFIVENVNEIDDKKVLDDLPDYNSIDEIIELQKKLSLEFLKNSL